MEKYTSPVISTYQFNLNNDQKKELEELTEFEHWDGFKIDRFSKSLEKKLRPIAVKYGTLIKIKNYETGATLTIEPQLRLDKWPSGDLEKELLPIVSRFKTIIKTENSKTGFSLTIESLIPGLYKGPELWFDSDLDALEHATSLLPMWEEDKK